MFTHIITRMYTLPQEKEHYRCSFLKKIDNLYVTNLVVSTSTKNGFIKKFEQKERF